MPTPRWLKLWNSASTSMSQQENEEAKAGANKTETKGIQIKIGTGDHDLELKAKTASKWIKEGHRVKVELFLAGRAKYMDEKIFERTFR